GGVRDFRRRLRLLLLLPVQLAHLLVDEITGALGAGGGFLRPLRSRPLFFQTLDLLSESVRPGFACRFVVRVHGRPPDWTACPVPKTRATGSSDEGKFLSILRGSRLPPAWEAPGRAGPAQSRPPLFRR